MFVAAKWFDPVIGIDIHLIQPPGPVPPIPVPHPFIGIVFDPMGLAVGMAIGAAMSGIFGGPFSGPVLVNGMPAANTGTEVKGMPVHIPIGGVFVIPPSNEGSIITGSKTVHVMGSSFARLTSIVMTCSDPVNLPTSVVMAIPMGPPVLIGGPPSLDILAAIMQGIKCKWVSDKLHAIFKAKPGSWRSKIICFLTGHPIDVASGRVLTDHTDFTLPGPIPFKFERNYYSASTYDGPLGHGWHHSYDQHITIRDDSIFLRAADGREIEFDYIEEGETLYEPVERLDLERQKDSFVVRTADRLIHRFGPGTRGDGSCPLTRIEDLNGNAITLQYENDRLVSIIDSCGRLLKLANDRNGRLVSLEAPHPDGLPRPVAVARYEYDRAGDLVAAYDALANAYRYAYENHLLVKETNRNGLSFYFEYDEYEPDGWCIHTWGDGGIYDHKLTYSKEGHITVVENSLGAKTTYICNDAGLVTKIIDALGGEKTIEWDDCCRKIVETDQLGRVFRYVYDARGNLTQLVDPIGSVTQFKYDASGLGTIMIDPTGEEWERIYDGKGNLVETRDPLGTRIRYRRDRSGRLTETILPGERKETFEIRQTDGTSEVVRFLGGSGQTHEYRRDHWGRLAHRTDALGSMAGFVYDLCNRLTETRMPNGRSFRYEYDAEGNQTREIGPDGNVVAFGYTGMARLAERRAAADRCVQLKYDTEGRLTSVINETGESARLERDLVGNLQEVEGFDGRTRQFRRDAAGELIGVRDSADRTSTFENDPMGRLVAKHGWDGESAFYEYDPFGRLISATNSNRRVEWERDALGRVLREKQQEFGIEHTYDSCGNRVRRVVSAPKGTMECSYVHDQANRVRRLETGRASIGLDWSKEGHLLGVEVGSAVHYTQAFDEIGRMTLQRLRTGSASDQFERAYTYDEASNLVERRDSQRGPSRFLYDRSGQLVGAEIPEFGKTSFSYDPAGNLTRFGDSERLQIEKGNRYRSSAERRLEYDSEGSITFLQERDEVAGWRFEYDTENRLRRGLRRTDTGDTLETIEFAYDAVGRRVLKRHNDRMTSYCWDGHLLAGEMTDGTDGEFTSYHFQPDSDFVPFLRETDSSVHLFVNDQLGVPQEIVDLDGELRWRGSYHPFGELLTQQCSAGVVSNPFRFPGQYFDEETGLCYNRNRYYDPKSGRYLTQDPIGLAGGLNPYAYALNPILWLDPLGLYDLALGLTRLKDGSNLRAFANSHNASTWTDLGFDGSRGMRQELERIIGGADSIHINLADLDVERALRDGHLGPGAKNITNWELWHVQQNWDKFKDKVTFWKDGKKADPPFKCS